MESLRSFGLVVALSLACEAGVLLYWYCMKDWGESARAPAPALVAPPPSTAAQAEAPPEYKVIERQEKVMVSGRLLELKAVAQEPLTEGNLRSLLHALATGAARGEYGPTPSRLRILVFSSRTGVDQQGDNWVAFYWASGDRPEPELTSIRSDGLRPPGPHQR
jgi:hypothetical protein